MFSALTKLPRTVWFLGAISFLNDAASDAVYPLLPLFFAATSDDDLAAMGLGEQVRSEILIRSRTDDGTPW